MIVVTGGAGFIGSNLVAGLNARGETDILVVDDLRQGDKFRNLADLSIADYMDLSEFRQRLALPGTLPPIRAVLHQGACSDTTESDGQYMMDNNYRYTLEVFEWCQQARVPLLYASSAAVYGAGPVYREDPGCERPLNVYGYSKYLFDQVLRRRMLQGLQAPVVGLRYFNVYGPREQHKGRMASVAFHHVKQMLAEGHVRLFEGTDGYAHGEQQRDFISVHDVVSVNLHFLDRPQISGIFNCGTGRAEPFNAVALAVINAVRRQQGQTALSLDEAVAQGLLRYIPFPNDLRGKYQSYTQADDAALRGTGYELMFRSVAQGVGEYADALLAAEGFPKG